MEMTCLNIKSGVDSCATKKTHITIFNFSHNNLFYDILDLDLFFSRVRVHCWYAQSILLSGILSIDPYILLKSFI